MTPEHPLSRVMQEAESATAKYAVRLGADQGNLSDLVRGEAIPYGMLCAKNPEYDAEYWTDLRAMYEGGRFLLRNPEVMERLFPMHKGETLASYEERKRRAYYVPHLATIIDVIVAGLGSDPIRMLPPGTESEGDAELPKFWKEFLDDCSHPGGEKQPFNDLISEQVRTGLLLGRFATLAELPRKRQFRDLAEQEASGALDAYAVPVAPECLLDWERDGAGELNWVNYQTVTCPRESVFKARDLVREEYRLYDRSGWVLYVVEYHKPDIRLPKKVERKKKPRPTDLIESVDADRHSFGRVPIIYQAVPPGLWAGNMIFSMAVEYLNKACGLSWAEYKTVYSQLYEFLEPPMRDIDGVPSSLTEDVERARRTRRAPGTVQVRSDKDDAKYVSPDTAGFAHVKERLDDLRQDMYRVTYQMALAEDNTGGLVRRSEESKNVDHEVTDVVLCALGKKIARPHAERVFDTAARGRGEEVGYTAAGADNFKQVDVTAMVERAVNIAAIDIPSATFRKVHMKRLAVADLEQDATPEIVEKIQEELEATITQDQFAARAEADEMDEDARTEEAAARGEEASRVQRGELPVSAKKPPKPVGKK